MKIKSLLFSALLLGAVGSTPARADYTPNFAVEPYAIDQTVIGADGWSYRIAPKVENPDSARVVALRWDDYKPTLVLRGANLANSSFAATKSGKATISFRLALTFPDGGHLRTVRIWLRNAPIGEIYFDHRTGLGYNGTGNVTSGTIILPKTETKVNSFYSFNIAVDYAKQSYDIKVTGAKKDGSPLEYKAQDVAFQGKSKAGAGLDGLYILTGSSLTTYLQDLKIESK